MLASACALRLPSIIVQLFEAQKKIRKIQGELVLEGGMVWKGSAVDSEGVEWIQEVESFKKRRKCQGSISGCRRFLEVSKNVRKLRNGSGRLERFGRV